MTSEGTLIAKWYAESHIISSSVPSDVFYLIWSFHIHIRLEEAWRDVNKFSNENVRTPWLLSGIKHLSLMEYNRLMYSQLSLKVHNAMQYLLNQALNKISIKGMIKSLTTVSMLILITLQYLLHIMLNKISPLGKTQVHMQHALSICP